MRRFGLLLFAVVGCGAETPPADPPGVTVRGVALHGRQPAAGAVLLFHGAAGGLPPRGVVGADGRFELTAPAGRYAVSVNWPTGSDENGGKQTSRVADRFTRKETTPLKPTVTAGPDGSCDLGTIVITK